MCCWCKVILNFSFNKMIAESFSVIVVYGFMCFDVVVVVVVVVAMKQVKRKCEKINNNNRAEQRKMECILLQKKNAMKQTSAIFLLLLSLLLLLLFLLLPDERYERNKDSHFVFVYLNYHLGHSESKICANSFILTVCVVCVQCAP